MTWLAVALAVVSPVTPATGTVAMLPQLLAAPPAVVGPAPVIVPAPVIAPPVTSSVSAADLFPSCSCRRGSLTALLLPGGWDE